MNNLVKTIEKTLFPSVNFLHFAQHKKTVQLFKILPVEVDKNQFNP